MQLTTLAGNDFTVTGADSFTSPGAADPDLQSFNTYAVKLAQYATTGAADGAIPANPHADAATNVFLYETWARPNMVTGALVANTDDTTGAITNTNVTAPEYYTSLENMTADLRAAYEGLAAANPIFEGVAPVGAAFLAAVENGTAIRDPYTTASGTTVGNIDLWWDDNLHASKYGSYLSGLTLFGTLTGLDPRSLGAVEHVASDLGITQAVAAALQNVAAATLGFTLDAHWTAPGQVTELTGGVTGLLASEGSFGFADSDVADTHTVAVMALTPGSVGTFTAALHTDTTGDGTGGSINWLFTVDNADVAFLAPGASSVEHFRVTISDANGGSAQQDIAVTLNGTYNDAPVATAPAAAYAATEQTLLDLKGTGISVSDVDGGSGTETATLTVSEGTITATSGDSGATIGNSGTSSITIQGTIDQINAVLGVGGTSTISYIDNSDTPAASVSLTIAIDDQGNSGSGSSLSGNTSTTINVTAVNDAPVNTVPGAQSTPDSTDHAISGLSVADPDATSLTTTLHVDHGTLTVAAVGGAAVSNSGSATVTLSGSTAQIDATLAAANNVVYRSALNFAGTDTLAITTNDGGSSGSGGALSDTDTVAIHVSVTVPIVSTVAASGIGISGGSGDLNAGKMVTLTAALSDTVFVNGGAPTLALNDGGVATYSGGSGTSMLTFQYMVGAGENTADLAILAIALNGATVRDAIGHDADLSGAVVNPAGTLQIDTTAPSAPTLLSVVNHGDHFDLLGGAEAGSTVTISDSNAAVTAFSSTAGGDGSFDAASMSALGDGSHSFTAVATDAAGNSSAASEPLQVVTQTVSGTHLAFSSDSFTIGDDSAVNVLILDGGGLTGTASSHGNTLYSIENSTTDVNTLIGGAGSDTLIGGIGADHLQGGGGDDFYAVYNSDTQISDSSGTDVAFVYGVNYALSDGDGVDVLIATGSGLTATGHATTATTLFSAENSVSDVNTLIGGPGNDILVGGIGADHLQGGDGNDTYAVFNSATVISDSAGYDIAYAQGVNYQIAEGSGVDGLVVFGSGLTGIGSSGDDALFSVGSSNTLSGGSAGSDSFIFDTLNTGNNIVTGFEAHSGFGSPGDTIFLQHFSDGSFDQAVADHHIFQSGNDVVIADTSQTIATLQGIQLASLHANDFQVI